MIPLDRIYLYRHPVDLRKAMDGLAVLVEETLGHNPFSGALFVFTNRRRDKVKLLYWERNGFCLWYKRLERERFRWPRGDARVAELSAEELDWLLRGIDLDKLRPHRELHYESVL